MDIHVANKTNMSWEVVYVIKKVRQLLGRRRVNKIVLSVGCGAVQAYIFCVCCVVKLLKPIT